MILCQAQHHLVSHPSFLGKGLRTVNTKIPEISDLRIASLKMNMQIANTWPEFPLRRCNEDKCHWHLSVGLECKNQSHVWKPSPRMYAV